MKIVKIVGRRGKWLAQVEGDWLPVLHDTWRIGAVGYCDPMRDVDTSSVKYREFIEALCTHGRAVIQKDAGDETMSRAGYHGVYKIDEKSIANDGSVTLTIVERIAIPR
jgi:hypothetical protein